MNPETFIQVLDFFHSPILAGAGIAASFFLICYLWARAARLEREASRHVNTIRRISKELYVPLSRIKIEYDLMVQHGFQQTLIDRMGENMAVLNETRTQLGAFEVELRRF